MYVNRNYNNAGELLVLNYPEILLPRKTYNVLKNDDVIKNAFVRETMIDIYQYLEIPGYEADDIISFIVAPQPSLREVFELSIYLYGYYTEQYIGIRAEDKSLNKDWEKKQPELRSEDIYFTKKIAYPLFLAASKLNNQEIDFNGDLHILSFSHKPTRKNFWHFEIWVKDSMRNRIPRDKCNAHTKYLAKSILEYIISEAVILKSSVNPYQ